MYKFIGTLNVESDIELRTYDVLIKITIESKQTHSKLNVGLYCLASNSTGT